MFRVFQVNKLVFLGENADYEGPINFWDAHVLMYVYDIINAIKGLRSGG